MLTFLLEEELEVLELLELLELLDPPELPPLLALALLVVPPSYLEHCFNVKATSQLIHTPLLFMTKLLILAVTIMNWLGNSLFPAM